MGFVVVTGAAVTEVVMGVWRLVVGCAVVDDDDDDNDGLVVSGRVKERGIRNEDTQAVQRGKSPGGLCNWE